MDIIQSLIIVVNLILVSSSKVINQTQECPDPQEILPCTCIKHEYTGSEIICNHVKTNDELANVFNRKFASTPFGKLTIDHNFDLEKIRVGDLGNASFTQIIISRGSMREIEPLAFASSYETAHVILLYANNITLFPFDEIQHFTELNFLDLSSNFIRNFPSFSSNSLQVFQFNSNEIGSIPVNALQGLPMLQEVDLMNCGISSVIPGTFTGLPYLKFAMLYENNITYLPTGAFDLSSMDSALFLTNNLIEDIEPGAFTGITRLVDASHNKLKVLQEGVWKPTLEAGATLSLDDNPFICGCDMAWLVLNSTLLAKVDTSTACEDGTFFTDLDPALFEDC